MTEGHNKESPVRRMLSVLACTILLSQTPALAEGCFDLESKRFGMDNKESYKPGVCASNVMGMLRSFINAGGNLADAKVVYVLHEMRQIAGGPMMPVELTPQRIRPELGTSTKNFKFHVFLTMGGAVYDLDFANIGVARSDYVAQMFDRSKAAQPDASALSRIQLIEIPAPDYFATWEALAKEVPERNRFDSESWVRGRVVEKFKAQAGTETLPIRKMSDWLATPAPQ